MPYWRLFYHLVWTTKQREPWLTPEVEPVIHDLLRTKAIGLGATVFAINGTLDHVHLIAAVPPTLPLAIFVGQVKGVATARYNQMMGSGDHIYWQEEYGAFTTDGKRLPYLIAYVECQKEHHRQGTIIPVLERVEEGLPITRLRESAVSYLSDEGRWHDEMMSLEDEL